MFCQILLKTLPQVSQSSFFFHFGNVPLADVCRKNGSPDLSAVFKSLNVNLCSLKLELAPKYDHCQKSLSASNGSYLYQSITELLTGKKIFQCFFKSKITYAKLTAFSKGGYSIITLFICGVFSCLSLDRLVYFVGCIVSEIFFLFWLLPRK